VIRHHTQARTPQRQLTLPVLQQRGRRNHQVRAPEAAAAGSATAAAEELVGIASALLASKRHAGAPKAATPA
jgi:hypothetical protein